MQTGVPDLRTVPLDGPAKHVKHVFLGLKSLGHDVRIVAQFGHQIWTSDDCRNFSCLLDLKAKRGPLRQVEKGVRRLQASLQLPYINLFESRQFAQVCEQALQGFDLLYERMGWMGYGGALAARSMGIPHVLEVNGDHLTEMESQNNAPAGMQRRLSQSVTAFAARNATLAVAPGEGTRQCFCERYSVPRERAVVIKNGTDLVERLSTNELRAFREDSAGSRPVNIAYVGGFNPWHGLDVLVEAAAGVIADGHNIILWLLGSGPEEQGVRNIVKRLGIEQHVHFVGQVATAEMAEHLKEADIGVSPYCDWNEFSGLKHLDYKAAGLATIASGKNGEPALIEHGRTGLIVPPCDRQALRQALVTLIDDPQLRKRMGRAARADAEKNHSWRKTAHDLSTLFNRCLGTQVTEGHT